MKKALIVLAVIAIAAPAWAVSLTTSVTGKNVTVGWSGNGTTAATRARAFALTVTVNNGAKITAISGYELSGGNYGIYPGTISIDSTSGAVTAYNTPVEPNQKNGAGASNLQTSQIITAQGSLYAAGAQAPGVSGNLFTITVDKGCTVTVTPEVTYRGGVVGEDANTMASVAAVTATVVDAVPTCWDAAQCGGQAFGDTNCDGKVNLADLAALKMSFNKNKGTTGYNCCADFNHDAKVNLGDLAVLKQHMNITTYNPRNLVTACPQ